MGIVFLAFLTLLGCPEAEQMMKPVVTTEPADTEEPTTDPEKPATEPTTNGEVKQPEEPEMEDPEEPETPEEPKEPAEEEVAMEPVNIEVGYYWDFLATEKLDEASTVNPGDTIYTKITFSRPVQHIVADDETARPALSFVLDDQATRYTTVASDVTEENFLPGTCKPLNNGTGYLCKVTIPADITTLALQVEADTVDEAGNPVTETTIRSEPLRIRPLIRDLPTTEVVVVGTEYTFTLEGITYPGYNPGPEVQRILNTHPSAKLPNFEEAVKMEEVVDWVYRTVWVVYPASVDKRVAARRAVKAYFGLAQEINNELVVTYINHIGNAAISKYWFGTECFRLILTHTEGPRLVYPASDIEELRKQFANSLRRGYIVGQTNPND